MARTKISVPIPPAEIAVSVVRGGWFMIRHRIRVVKRYRGAAGDNAMPPRVRSAFLMGSLIPRQSKRFPRINLQMPICRTTYNSH